jgi:hypothetical protein
MDNILAIVIYFLIHIIFYRAFKLDINLFLLFLLPIIFFTNIIIFFSLEILIVLFLIIISNIIFFKGVKNFGPSMLIINYIILNKPKKISYFFDYEKPMYKRLLINIKNKYLVKKNNYFILTTKSKLICKLYFNTIALFNLY